MAKIGTKQLMRIMQEKFYEEMRVHLRSLGNGGQYTKPQKEYVIEQIDEYGVRATARILQVPRRTLQRWCREYSVVVKRCPYWVYEWARKRRKRRDFWRRKGYI
ncbi:hypothetical protein N9A72_00430 [bacterium]|nr:hypothetical protein [bacterium]